MWFWKRKFIHRIFYNEVIIQTYFFHNRINKLFSEDNKVPRILFGGDRVRHI